MNTSRVKRAFSVLFPPWNFFTIGEYSVQIWVRRSQAEPWISFFKPVNQKWWELFFNPQRNFNHRIQTMAEEWIETSSIDLERALKSEILRRGYREFEIRKVPYV